MRINSDGNEDRIVMFCFVNEQLKDVLVTVSLQDSLHSLMGTLSVSNPFFIRCIKPNMEKVGLITNGIGIEILSLIDDNSHIFLYCFHPKRIQLCLTQKSS